MPSGNWSCKSDLKAAGCNFVYAWLLGDKEEVSLLQNYIYIHALSLWISAIADTQ